MPSNKPLAQKLLDLRRDLAAIPVEILTARTGASVQFPAGGELLLQLPLWDREVLVAYPGGQVLRPDGAEERDDVQALVLYHLLTADGSPLTGEWIGFSSLPNAAFYQQAYQGYSGALLSQAFGEDEQAFARAALLSGGRQEPFASSAFSFLVLPHLVLLAAFWRGDEDFSASYKVLFDAAAGRQLPTDVLAIVGGMLARRLVKVSQQG